jgi:Rrf2 family protein
MGQSRLKISTRARYGLRLMIELARGTKSEKLMHLGRVGQITGISESYLAQLAIPLKKTGLMVGVSGKKGGYHLGRPAEEITIADIVEAMIGHISLTECSSNPSVCLNAEFCEARVVWSLMSDCMNNILASHTLANLLDRDHLGLLKEQLEVPANALPADAFDSDVSGGCPLQPGGGK